MPRIVLLRTLDVNSVAPRGWHMLSSGDFYVYKKGFVALPSPTTPFLQICGLFTNKFGLSFKDRDVPDDASPTSRPQYPL